MSASAKAPETDGADISNLGASTSTDKWFIGDAYGDPSSAKGQSFKTGNAEVVLKAITYQVTKNQQAAPVKTYVVRVGTVSGTNFTEIHKENATQDFLWRRNEYMTWTLEKPVRLSANTTYGIDVGMKDSTSIWETGIPYLTCTGNSYKDGQRYSSGKSGTGDKKVKLDGNRDRVFHLDLEGTGSTSPAAGTPTGEPPKPKETTTASSTAAPLN